MSSVQGVPEQDKPENQDPSVAYSIDGMTGEKTPYEGFELPKETGEEKPERRSKQRQGSDKPEQSEEDKKKAEEKADEKNKSVKAASTATAGGTGAHAGKP